MPRLFSRAPAASSAQGLGRDPRLDVLKGVLIAGVVLGHFLETSGGQAPSGLYSGWDVEPQRAVLTLLYVFHMPLFVLLAGVTASRRQLGHRIAQMVGLYLVLQVSYLLVRSDVPTVEALFHPVYAMWFLLAMGWWLASLPLVARLGHAALPAALLVSLVTVALPVADTDLVAWARAACYWPFFVAGHLYGRELLRRAADAGPALIAPAATLLAAVTSLVMVSGVDPRWYRGADTAGSMDDAVQVAVVVRVACFAAAVLSSLALLALVPGRNAVAETLGRRSLAIYALHVPLVFAAQAWFDGRGIDPVPASLLAVAMTVASLALLSLPWFDAVVRQIAGRMATVITSVLRSPAPAVDSSDRPHSPYRQPQGPRQLLL